MAMDMSKLHLIYHHSSLLSRSLFLKILLVSTAVAVLPFLAPNTFDVDPSDGDAPSVGCDSTPFSSSGSPALPPPDLDAVMLDLIAEGYLSLGDRSLCVGGRDAAGAMRRVGFLREQVAAEAGCGGLLPFGDDSFDFVFSAGLDRVRAPARLVLEMERVLVPGRAGAVLAAGPPERPKSLVRTAAPVAAMLRVSDVVAVRTVSGSAVVVVFLKKRSVV